MNSLLNINNISFRLPASDKPILTDISYTAQTGDFIILLGSNGSGKSTLLKLLNRHYVPSKGDIFLENKSINNYSNKLLSKQIITLSQDCHDSLFVSLTLFENFQIIKQDKHKDERLFLSNYLKNFNANLANKLDQQVEKLSGGEKQAFALALAVLYPPRILLLDEHTSALDPKSAKHLMAMTAAVIKQRNITCILTTHDLDIALEYGNRILALRQGKIAVCIENIEKKALNQHRLMEICY